MKENPFILDETFENEPVAVFTHCMSVIINEVPHAVLLREVRFSRSSSEFDFLNVSWESVAEVCQHLSITPDELMGMCIEIIQN